MWKGLKALTLLVGVGTGGNTGRLRGQKSGRLLAETYQPPFGFSLELRGDPLTFRKSGNMTVSEVTRWVS